MHLMQAQHLPSIKQKKNALCSGLESYQFIARAYPFTEDDHNMRPREGEKERRILENPSLERF